MAREVLASYIRQLEQHMSKSLLMGTEEFRELTGVPINTQKDWRAKGSNKGLQSAVIGGKIKYRRADVLTWIDEQFAESRKGGDVKTHKPFTPLGNRSKAAA